MRISTQKGWLEPLSVSHAYELFNVIHVSRSHLHPWLPWPQRLHSPEDTQAFVLRLLAERGPQFVIRAHEHVCGGVGFHLLDKTAGTGDIGYWLGSEFIRQGIMSDAVTHLCSYGFTALGLHQVTVRCAEQNLNSRKVPERLGFYHEGIEVKAEWLSDRYIDHAVYSILRSEFNVLYPEHVAGCFRAAHSQSQ